MLELQYGPFLESRTIAVLLTLAQDDIAHKTSRYTADTGLPNGEYDYITEEQIEFSAYSPEELPQRQKLTWHILNNVVDGLIDLLILSKKPRQVSFRIKDGPDSVFLGYGHVYKDIWREHNGDLDHHTGKT